MPIPIDKRAIVRDQKIANLGLLRRIQLRMKAVPTLATNNVDPTQDFSVKPTPDNDVTKIVAGNFSLIKSTQGPTPEGVMQAQRGRVWFPPVYKDLYAESYSMKIGGTGKEWKKVSAVQYDNGRLCYYIDVEASQ